MVEEFGPSQAFRDVFGQKSFEETSHVGTDRFRPFDRFFADHFDQMKNVVREERRLAVIHFVENATQRPEKTREDVDQREFLVTRDRPNDRTASRRPVRDTCTTAFPKPDELWKKRRDASIFYFDRSQNHRVHRHVSRKSKIAKFHFSTGKNQNVLRFHI